MSLIEKVTMDFVKESQRILGNNLIGIYLHGSAVMDCFNEKKSDIDLLVVVNDEVSDEVKLKYMNMIVDLNQYAPSKGIEMSLVKKSVCNPFVYPTPFELHFSVMHLDWFKKNPLEYIAKMKGTDKDLAAHFTIIFYRGKCLFGCEISEVFEKVKEDNYFDSIFYDIENASEDIFLNPSYIILNLCRVLAYKKEGLVLSKKEGGEWGLKNTSIKYHSLVKKALEEYESSDSFQWDNDNRSEFASYMMKQIN